ncbi:MAG: hypothetical protein ABI618_12005 [Nitrospirota bacterium]|nr:hypothetical protein [Nitrospirales bacterium]
MMTQQSASSVNTSLSVLVDDSAQNGKLLHSLSNKLLPIVVFSELALRRCDDDQLKRQLEKIHGAAEQARDILVEIRSLHAARNS